MKNENQKRKGGEGNLIAIGENQQQLQILKLGRKERYKEERVRFS